MKFLSILLVPRCKHHFGFKKSRQFRLYEQILGAVARFLETPRIYCVVNRQGTFTVKPGSTTKLIA